MTGPNLPGGGSYGANLSKRQRAGGGSGGGGGGGWGNMPSGGGRWTPACTFTWIVIIGLFALPIAWGLIQGMLLKGEMALRDHKKRSASAPQTTRRSSSGRARSSSSSSRNSAKNDTKVFTPRQFLKTKHPETFGSVKVGGTVMAVKEVDPKRADAKGRGANLLLADGRTQFWVSYRNLDTERAKSLKGKRVILSVSTSGPLRKDEYFAPGWLYDPEKLLAP